MDQRDTDGVEKRLRQPTVTIKTIKVEDGKTAYLVNFAGVGYYCETTRKQAEASKKHLLKTIQSKRAEGKIITSGCGSKH